MVPISHPRVIGGFGGRGKVSQSIHKPFLQSIHKAFTKAFTKHSQEHSQSSHKSIYKALTRTYTKLSQTLSREARRFFLVQPHGPECGALPPAARRFFQDPPPRARTRRREEEKKRRRRREENTNLTPQVSFQQSLSYSHHASCRAFPGWGS